MISQIEFIKNVQGKKVRIQNYFVKILRLICNHIPLSFPQNKEKHNYVYVTICRASDFDMVKSSLYSLYKNANNIPKKIIIISDGSWNVNEGYRYFQKYNLNIQFLNWKECADHYNQICPELTIWAQKHIWGKKMAAILYCSEKENVLFSDPDILWYKNPISEKDIDDLKFKISIDNSHNYDMEFIEKYHFEKLLETQEPINCGAVYISGGLQLLPQEAIECIKYEAQNPGKFAEQTVFAIMDLYYNSRWTMKEITSEINDLLYPFWTHTISYPNMIARHYLWRLKWIYWKDYLNMLR